MFRKFPHEPIQRFHPGIRPEILLTTTFSKPAQLFLPFLYEVHREIIRGIPSEIPLLALNLLDTNNAEPVSVSTCNHVHLDFVKFNRLYLLQLMKIQFYNPFQDSVLLFLLLVGSRRSQA